MSKETLSMKQAKAIIDQTNSIISEAKQRMEEKNNDFVQKVSKVWEDKNAVDFMGIHKKNFEDFIKELGDNNRTFGDTVKSIADGYAKVAGIAARLSFSPLMLSANVIISAVKEHFDGGENGDDFGFINPESGANQVMDAFTELKTALEKISNDAIQRIKSVNAFGNVQVQMNLAQSAGKIVSILNEHIGVSEKQVRDYVEKTALNYIKLGQSAATAANIGEK